MIERAAYNERFAKMAGVFPLKNLCELATICPAGSSMEAATTPSRHHVVGNGRTAQWETEAK